MGGPSVPTDSIRFGLFEFDPQSGELRKQGIKIRLQGQPVEILSMLLARPGQLVTREELEKKLWSADTFVDFERSLNAAMKRLRAALGDSAETPRFIETLARRGYRFIAPVDTRGMAPAAPPEPSPPRLSLQRRYVMPVTLAVALVAVGVMLNRGKTTNRRETDNPSKRMESLLVLPLKNLSSDAEQGYFADGM